MNLGRITTRELKGRPLVRRNRSPLTGFAAHRALCKGGRGGTTDMSTGCHEDVIKRRERLHFDGAFFVLFQGHLRNDTGRKEGQRFDDSHCLNLGSWLHLGWLRSARDRRWWCRCGSNRVEFHRDGTELLDVITHDDLFVATRWQRHRSFRHTYTESYSGIRYLPKNKLGHAFDTRRKKFGFTRS